MQEAMTAVQIVSSLPDHTFELNVEALESLLLREDVREKPVCVVSIAGAFRKGKSFLLNFFQRYLDAEGCDNWLGDDDNPLKGFSWRGGCERDTNGIVLWNEPYFVKTLDAGEVAVILMDTQGAFDSDSTVRDCATIFAFSTMISSIQVYNLSNQIQENDLHHLELFTEYGRLALQESPSKPFQSLLFLIRDWSYPYELEYGAEGGAKFLKKCLKVTDSQHPELQKVRRHIEDCFTNISCFLMPHPGIRAATNLHFDGRLSDIESSFVSEMRHLAPLVLSPENIKVKEIQGRKVTGRDLLQYFKSYITIYKDNELPEPKTIMMATAEANNMSAMTSAKDLYENSMESVCGGELPYLSLKLLEEQHLQIQDKAIKRFKDTKVMGGDQFSNKYLHQLEEDINCMYKRFKMHNEGKSAAIATRTPAILIMASVCLYVAAELFEIVGIVFLTNLANFFAAAFLLQTISWLFIRFSGNFEDTATLIDTVADSLYELVSSLIHEGILAGRSTADRKKPNASPNKTA